MIETIRILVVDDHPVVRHGLRGMIGLKPGLEVVGEAEDGVEAVLQARTLQPDVILLDLIMPRMDGIAVIKELKKENLQARILVLTSLAEAEKLSEVLDAGAMGCILKDSSPAELVRAIRDVYHMELYLHPVVARKLFRKPEPQAKPEPATDSLTDREVEVVKLVARGASNREISVELCISEQTVRGHVTNILSKLHLSNRSQVVLYALRTGLARLDP